MLKGESPALASLEEQSWNAELDIEGEIESPGLWRARGLPRIRKTNTSLEESATAKLGKSPADIPFDKWQLEAHNITLRGKESVYRDVTLQKHLSLDSGAHDAARPNGN